MKYAKGVCWIDDTRIPFVDEDWNSAMDKRKSFVKTGGGHQNQYVGGSLENPIDTLKSINQQGRFTPNLLVCDDMLNDGVITKKSNPKITPVGIGRGVIGNHDGRKTITKAKEGMEMLRSVGDGGSNSRFYDLDKWFDKVIDEISSN